MNVAIFGAGAVGGFIGTLLAKQGNDVSAVARGATAAALRADGWRLLIDNGMLDAPARVSEDPAELGPQDLVIVAVKAPALADVAPRLAPLLGPDTMVLTAMNGVPWWFFDGFGGEQRGLKLQSIDPGGRISAAIPTRRVIGAVLHWTCSQAAPGVVRHGIGKRIILGEPSGSASARLAALIDVFSRAGFEPEVSSAIQTEIWFKLWGNMTMNPISALTGATADRILDDPLVEKFIVAAMGEGAAIGARIGCAITESAAARNRVTRELGAFKTSMLRDLEAGRPLELDALLAAVQEIGTKVGVATPSLDALLGLTRLMARTRGLYG
jgi:2-dehydropantoate 2-reductase